MSNMPMIEVPVPTVVELELDKYIPSGRSSAELIARRQLLLGKIDDFDDERKSIDLELGIALDFRGVKNAVWEDYLLVRRAASKPRATLDRVLLLEAGVTPQQLEAGTRFSEAGSPGIMVKSLSK